LKASRVADVSEKRPYLIQFCYGFAKGEPSQPVSAARFLLCFLDVEQALVSQFETLLPLARTWASEQEQRILREGVPLSDQEIADAKKIGVKNPERVRLLQVDAIPAPSHPVLKAACAATNFVPATPRGLTLHYGVFVRSDHWRKRELIVHELVHTAQYERLGGIEPFLRQYLFECATLGYAKSPMEEEAISTTARLCVS
jgi:hypothetical protein